MLSRLWTIYRITISDNTTKGVVGSSDCSGGKHCPDLFAVAVPAQGGCAGTQQGGDVHTHPWEGAGAWLLPAGASLQEPGTQGTLWLHLSLQRCREPTQPIQLSWDCVQTQPQGRGAQWKKSWEGRGTASGQHSLWLPAPMAGHSLQREREAAGFSFFQQWGEII